MKAGYTVKIKSDIIRMVDRKEKVLAKKNDDVLIIGISDPAVIVQHCKTKEKFSTTTDNIKP